MQNYSLMVLDKINCTFFDMSLLRVWVNLMSNSKKTIRYINTISCLFLSYLVFGQIDNPIPNPIKHSGLVVKLENVLTIPQSAPDIPLARINMLREAPDNLGRLFINDLRGPLWVVVDGIPQKFMDLSVAFSNFIDSPGRGTGFGDFAFHPDFLSNGLFYTTHTESPSSAIADFTPKSFDQLTMQWIITEWKCTNPLSNTFEGSKRELLRFDFAGNFHGLQQIAFNPNSSAGDEDFGLLYIGIGDGTSALNLQEENLQNLTSFLGTIFRSDPLGNNSTNGKYGIPDSNPYVNTTVDNVLKEIFAYGFRNPHRFSWDTEEEHIMLCGDIGEKNVEEVNQILPGHNYGWSQREGTFVIDMQKGRENVYNLPTDDAINNYTYPVAQYDHDEGSAVVGGFVYRGLSFPELYGQYIFGDIVSGLLFHVPVDQIHLGSQATIHKVATLGADGHGTSLLAEVNHDRVDLRFGTDNSGEIYVLSKVDGSIRKIVHPDAISLVPHEAASSVGWLTPNPSNGDFSLHIDLKDKHLYRLQIFNTFGIKVYDHKDLGHGDRLNLNSLPSGVYWALFINEGRQFTQKIVLN